MIRKRVVLFFLIALSLLAVDAWLKAYVHSHIPLMNGLQRVYPYGGIPVFKNCMGIQFCIVHVLNTGAAWGMFRSAQELLLLVRVVVILGLLLYLFTSRKTDYVKFCLMLIAAGAIGNVIDSFVYGHVVDMFYFNFWGFSYPVFNIADSAIFLGVALLFVRGLRS